MGRLRPCACTLMLAACMCGVFPHFWSEGQKVICNVESPRDLAGPGNLQRNFVKIWRLWHVSVYLWFGKETYRILVNATLCVTAMKCSTHSAFEDVA